MKTKGGYKIESFKKLVEPIKRGILEPHIYQGKVINVPNLYDNGYTDTVITWDKSGRCSNWKREDCFIDVEKLINYE